MNLHVEEMIVVHFLVSHISQIYINEWEKSNECRYL